MVFKIKNAAKIKLLIYLITNINIFNYLTDHSNLYICISITRGTYSTTSYIARYSVVEHLLSIAVIRP